MASGYRAVASACRPGSLVTIDATRIPGVDATSGAVEDPTAQAEADHRDAQVARRHRCTVALS